MKRNVSEKILLRMQKNNKSFEEENNNRFLISINVVGSCGPIRFVVNEGDVVASVIQNTLKSYARQGRLPLLGSDINQFLLYCANAEADALNPGGLIGSCGGRNFLLCKKQIQPQMTEARSERSGSWKAWLYKCFHFNI